MIKGRNPFSAGRWVVGEAFFGRNELIEKINQSTELCDWVIGQRRVGKTSLLRQIEWLSNRPDTNKFALFWDIQGSFNAEGLTESLLDAIDDSMDQYPELWEQINLKNWEDLPCPNLLKQLSRAVCQKGKTFVLLIDEAEEFMSIGQENPAVLGKLRKFFQNPRLVHTIISSTPKLEQFHKTISVETSPLLHGFHARYLGMFTKTETHELLSCGFEESSICDEIFLKTGGNPFESQLMAKHLFEHCDLKVVSTELERNPSLIQVLEVNFDLLIDEEQDILKDVYCGKSSKAFFTTSLENAIISKLVQMGYLTEENDQLRISSHFLGQWLGTKFDSIPAFHTHHRSDPILDSEHQKILCKNIVNIYKFFLETTQSGKVPEEVNPTLFRVSELDQSVYPNQDFDSFRSNSEPNEPWKTAISLTVSLVSQITNPEDSWAIYRFCQMASKMESHYSETDLLDLMLLIAEEASL